MAILLWCASVLVRAQALLTNPQRTNIALTRRGALAKLRAQAADEEVALSQLALACIPIVRSHLFQGDSFDVLLRWHDCACVARDARHSWSKHYAAVSASLSSCAF